MFIHGKCDIINMFSKERRSKHKPAYALNTQNVLHFSCLYRDFSLVVEIWFKVLEKSWKSTGQQVWLYRRRDCTRLTELSLVLVVHRASLHCRLSRSPFRSGTPKWRDLSPRSSTEPPELSSRQREKAAGFESVAIRKTLYAKPGSSLRRTRGRRAAQPTSHEPTVCTREC